MGDLHLQDIVLLYGVLLISLTVHEAAHAWLAMLGGDRTAYTGGQVSLNPIPHVRREPFGTVVLPLLVLFGSNGAWCMGFASTPIDARWAYDHPRRAALMSLAGPASNFLLAALAWLGLYALVATGLADAVPTMHGSGHHSAIRAIPGVRGDELTPDLVFAAGRILTTFVLLNILLGIFNLFPWPPLDGSGILEGLFPRQLRGFYGYIRSNPLLIILGMLGIWRLLPGVFWPVYERAILDWL